MERAERDFSDELEEWLRSAAPKTLGGLAEAFAEKSFAVTIMLLMFPSSLPLPTGGITHIFEAVTVLLSLQMVAGRRIIWLPNKWRSRELGSATTGKAIPFIIRRVRFFERYSRPRWAGLFDHIWFLRILGLVIIMFTAGAIVAPPFSGLDTLPSLGVVIIALSIILGDVVVLIAGMVVGAGGVILILTVGATLARFLRDLF